MSDQLLKEGIEAVRDSLRVFGCGHLTTEAIEEAHRKFMAGDKMTNIIEMMAEGQFKDHPEIFGDPA